MNAATPSISPRVTRYLALGRRPGAKRTLSQVQSSRAFYLTAGCGIASRLLSKRRSASGQEAGDGKSLRSCQAGRPSLPVMRGRIHGAAASSGEAVHTASAAAVAAHSHLLYCPYGMALHFFMASPVLPCREKLVAAEERP